MSICIPKEQWGEGPWSGEPDHEVWVDHETDFPCILNRFGGTWCGYVGVPPDHPANSLSYYQSAFNIEDVESGRAAELAPAQKAVNDIDVHGGLTFSGKRDDMLPDTARCRDWHFFGFDCNHAGDFDPQMAAYWRCAGRAEWANDLGKPTGWGGTIQYRDIDYAREQCRKVARQLAAMRNLP